jgi:RHS repeat-associated protein
MEKDEETGLSRHGVRMYATWLGRWTSADPSGTQDGPNRYLYCRGNPGSKLDNTGRATDESPVVHPPTTAPPDGSHWNMFTTSVAVNYERAKYEIAQSLENPVDSFVVQPIKAAFYPEVLMQIAQGAPAGEIADTMQRRALAMASLIPGMGPVLQAQATLKSWANTAANVRDASQGDQGAANALGRETYETGAGLAEAVAAFAVPELAARYGAAPDALVSSSFTDSGAPVFYESTSTRIGSDAVSTRVQANVLPAEGFHDVIVHGKDMSDGLGSMAHVDNLTPLNTEQVANAVRGNPDYVPGTPIRLLSCYGACGGPASMAGDLAASLNVDVVAATSRVQMTRVVGATPVTPGGEWTASAPDRSQWQLGKAFSW